MNTEITNRLFLYKTTLMIMKNMLINGIISKEEYATIDTIIAEKYGFDSCSFFR